MKENKKKVLFLIHDLGPGGAEKVLVNLANNLDREKYDVTIQTLFDVGVNKQFIAPHVRYIGGLKRMFRGNIHIMKCLSPKNLHRLIVREKYDYEVAYLEGPCARIICGCDDTKTKKICWIHIEQKTAANAARAFRSIQEAELCYNKFDRIICVSETVKKDFSDILGIKAPTDVLYNTNESDKILALSNDEVTECDFSSEEIKIVSVGKLLKSKGVDRTLRIIKRLVAEGDPVHFYVLGIGEEEDNLKRYIQENDLKEKCTMLGYQTNPYKYVAKCDLFVCASKAEGFSTAATEALIVGTPVCTVEVSGMKEMLGENNEYGIVTENSEEALYQGIKGLLDDPALLIHYKRQAEIRGKVFSTENTVRAVEEMLLKL